MPEHTGANQPEAAVDAPSAAVGARAAAGREPFGDVLKLFASTMSEIGGLRAELTQMRGEHAQTQETLRKLCEEVAENRARLPALQESVADIKADFSKATAATEAVSGLREELSRVRGEHAQTQEALAQVREATAAAERAQVQFLARAAELEAKAGAPEPLAAARRRLLSGVRHRLTGHQRLVYVDVRTMLSHARLFLHEGPALQSLVQQAVGVPQFSSVLNHGGSADHGRDFMLEGPWRGGIGAWHGSCKGGNEWAVIRYPQPAAIIGVATAGRAIGSDQYCKKYKLQYLTDDLEWRSVADGIAEFAGNTDRTGFVLHAFPPVVTRAIRIEILEFHVRPSLRFETYGWLR